jgi:hypothetical protein
MLKKADPEAADHLAALKAEGIFDVILRFKKKRKKEKPDTKIRQNANMGK